MKGRKMDEIQIALIAERILGSMIELTMISEQSA